MKKNFLAPITLGLFGMFSVCYLGLDKIQTDSILLENIEALSDPPEEIKMKGTSKADGDVCHILLNGYWRSGRRINCYNVDQVETVCIQNSCGFVKE